MGVEPVRVGLVGTGQICGVYLGNARRWPTWRVVACTDLARERARAVARQRGLRHAETTEALLADGEVELVLNLTIPAAHAEVNRAALSAGRHVYCEKPLAIDRATGQDLVEQARSCGLRLGGAPDTFLGSAWQTARRLVDDGLIGRPVAATAFMLCAGHESWHANPDFYYQRGGGPMFDMGPYYLSALIHLLGPVKSVAAMACKGREERVATSEACRGRRIRVETPTHVAGTVQFAGGAVATMVTSFDCPGSRLGPIELHGVEGSLALPDPNGFGGEILHMPRGGAQWRSIAASGPHTDNCRGLGVADMAAALRAGRPHRASEALCLHVLDVMQAFLDSHEARRIVDVTTTCERPEPLGDDLLR